MLKAALLFAALALAAHGSELGRGVVGGRETLKQEILTLKTLYQRGALTRDELEQAKAKLYAKHHRKSPSFLAKKQAKADATAGLSVRMMRQILKNEKEIRAEQHHLSETLNHLNVAEINNTLNIVNKLGEIQKRQDETEKTLNEALEDDEEEEPEQAAAPAKSSFLETGMERSHSHRHGRRQRSRERSATSVEAALLEQVKKLADREQEFQETVEGELKDLKHKYKALSNKRVRDQVVEARTAFRPLDRDEDLEEAFPGYDAEPESFLEEDEADAAMDALESEELADADEEEVEGDDDEDDVLAMLDAI